jgi:hypothetical protein
LKQIAKAENMELQRLRRQIAFDRFLVRLFPNADRPWVLKGGYARTFHNSQERTSALPLWTHQYNWHRPTPASTKCHASDEQASKTTAS